MKLTSNKMNFIGMLGFGIAALSFSASAEQELSYSYLELDYINLDIDEVGDSGDALDDLDNGDGWGVRGSYALSPNWFAFANYSVTQSDTSFTDDQNQSFNSDTDINRLDIGAGYHTPINTRTDVVYRLAYTDYDTDGFNFGASSSIALNDLNDDNSDGYYADVSLRSQLGDKLEGSAGLRYTDVENNDDLGIIGNLMYEFSPALGLNFGMEAGDNITQILIGLRYSFDSEQPRT